MIIIKKRKEITTVNELSGRTEESTTNTNILILVFAEVIYSVNGLFLEIRERPEKLDNIDGS